MNRGALSRLALVSLCFGCSGREHEGQELANARARGALVAKVDGASIGLDQVRELVDRGLPPRVALQRLEEEQLLAREAARRGYGGSAALEQELKRALVQALLAQTVELVRAEDISAQEVRKRFDEVASANRLAPESFKEHELEVRKQLLEERRTLELNKLTASLRDRIGVRLSEAEVDKLLSDPAFWGEGT
jgi:hypothetical protein